MGDGDDAPSSSGGWLQLRHLWLLIPWVGIGIAALQSVSDNSFLWHVAAGRLQLDTGEVVRADPFSFSFAGEQWRTQSWLIDLGYGVLDQAVGLRFVPYWIAAIGLIMVTAIGLAVYQRTSSLTWTAGILAGITWMGVAYLVPRPVLVSFALLPLLVLVVARDRLRWTIPLIIWLWAASHGSFIIGIGFLVLESIRTRRRRYVFDALVAAVAATATAHGYHVWLILGRFLENRDALEVIAEWAPPEITSPVAWPYAAAVMLLVISAAGGRLRPRDVWLVGPIVLFGLTSQRAMFPALLILAPWLVGSKTKIESAGSGSGGSTLVNAAMAAAIVALPFFFAAGPGRIDAEKFPVALAEQLEARTVFHDDFIGGFLIYAAWPSRLVLVDDRAELYGREFFTEVIASENGTPAWKTLFERFTIDEALVREDDGIVEALRAEGWRESGSDDGFLILRRSR